MKVINKSKSITEISIPDNKVRLLLLSDIHFDSAYCERKLLKATLEDAMSNNAIVLINGDFFDMMQSRNDKRGSKSNIRQEYLGDNYFDLVIEDAFEFLKPYAKNIAVMADGNHETAITKNYESNPLDRLCYLLSKEAGSPVVHKGYQGWVILQLHISKTTKVPYFIKMHHGSGGNARVTKGVIEHNRMGSFVEGADIVWLGHTHTQYCLHSTVERLASSNTHSVIHERVYQVRTGCWKQEYKEGGWSVEKGFSPSEIGGYWVDILVHRVIDNGVRTVETKTQIYQT